MNSYTVSCYHDPETGEFITNEGDILPFRFFPQRRVFMTSEGEEVFFRIVNSQFMFSLSEAYKAKHKPKMPQIAIEYEEGKFTFSGNEKDPWYIDAMNDFYEALGLFMMERNVSLSCKVVIPSPYPEDFLAKLDVLDIDPVRDAKEKNHTIKYLYIMHLLTTEEETKVFLNIVAGQSLPTKSAMEVAEERFPSSA